MALLRVTRAYRSVSHEAMQVLTGSIPIDLLLREEYFRHKMKREGLVDLPANLRERICGDPDRWKRILRENTLEEWSQRWVTTPKGATLRKYFPTVGSRMENTWVHPDYWVSQFLTGHGGFRAKLKKHGLDIDPLCPTCGVPETAEHIILECIAYEALRAKLLRETGLYVLTEGDLPQLMSKENHPYFKAFVYGWKEIVGIIHFRRV